MRWRPTVGELRGAVVGAVISAIAGGLLTALNVTTAGDAGPYSPLLMLAGLSALLIALLAGIKKVVAPGTADQLQFMIAIMWLMMMLRVIN